MKKIKQKTWKLVSQLALGYVKPGIFGKKKLLLAFEYGLVLSDVAKNKKIELTPEIVERAESILLDVCRGSTTKRVGLDMIPNILSMFETRLDD